MTRKVVVRLRAKADMREARHWYEGQRAGLGAQFTAAVGATLNGLLAMRDSGSVPRLAGTVDRFPYKDLSGLGRIVVVADYHSSRDPAGWQERIDEESRR